MKIRRLLPLLALLAFLPGCKEKKEYAAAPVDPKLVINDTVVNPLCFLSRGPEDAPAYKIQNCDNGEFKADTQNPSPLSPEFVSTGYFYTDASMPEQQFPGFVGYRYLGDYRGLKAIEIVENGGGSGTFTSLQLLRPEKDGTLRLVETLASGDRCNGGITNAFMDERTLVFDVNLTPYDFFTVAEYNPKNLEAYDDIDACAACCYATLRYVNGKAESVTLLADAIERIRTVPEEEQTTQSCFDEVFGEKVKAGETVMSLKDVKNFVIGFTKICTAQ